MGCIGTSGTGARCSSDSAGSFAGLVEIRALQHFSLSVYRWLGWCVEGLAEQQADMPGYCVAANIVIRAGIQANFCLHHHLLHSRQVLQCSDREITKLHHYHYHQQHQK